MAGSVGFSDSEDEAISGINVTPLVDVVLVLLVIFLITAPVIYQSAIKVQLPQAGSGETTTAKGPLEFSITHEGSVYWDSQPVNWNELAARVTTVMNQNPEQTAIISADRNTPHGTVVKLMDSLRNAGLTRFALNVESSK